jgi:hypothetical protein
MNFWAHLDKNGKVLEKQPNHYPEPIVYYESSKGEQGVNPLKPLGVSVEVARQNAGSPRNPESLKK